MTSGGFPHARIGAVAVLPLVNYILDSPLLEEYGLATSPGRFAAAHRELVADPKVKAVA